MVVRSIGRHDPEGLPSGSSEDRDLTLAFQSGDKGSYQQIHDRHAARVHAVCSRMLGNREDAQEAAQETFLRVYQALGRFNGRYQLGAWIARIATNVCLDHLRARSRRPVDASVELLELDHECEDEHDPEAVAMRRADGRRIRKVLAGLPPLHRAAIVLRDFEGLSYQEIAQILDISDGQVKALIHRARRRFKRDWGASVAALLPWRLVQRFRGNEHLGRESAVIGSAAQVAPACSSAMQQCGQYMLDKLAPVLTLALVTSGAVAPVMPAAGGVTEPERPVSRPAVEPELAPIAARNRSGTDRDDRPKVLMAADRNSEEGDTATDVPAPSDGEVPAPSPTPSATAPPSGGGSTDGSQGGGGTAGPTPTPSPTPAGPFTAAIGFDWGRAIPQRLPKSHYANVSCTPSALVSLEQRLETVVEDDDTGTTYPALLQLRANSDSPRGPVRVTLSLTVWKQHHEIIYTGQSATASATARASALDLKFQGSYSTTHQGARNVDLPHSGGFGGTLTLDCAAHSVTAESVTFSV